MVIAENTASAMAGRRFIRQPQVFLKKADERCRLTDRTSGGVRITLAPYDVTWPRQFEEHRQRIAAALDGVARRIEHVGSTAVQGLCAKPVIDVLVTVDDDEEEAAYLIPLEKAGYELHVREPQHRMFRTPERTAHVHIWKAESADEARHLEFRDRLRAHPEWRQLYEEVKRDLATQLWNSSNDYAEAKTAVITAILDARTEN
jgi:GrpB-like predicted nucleotidyltransferase (UPF0157 family)